MHRDIKPHNVILDEEGRAKVTDFGIARAGASDMTETGSIMGTAQYLSPEQAQGQPVSPRSDLYSIGVMLYELLTGRVPFDAESAVTIALKHVSERPSPPSQLNPAVPPALEAVVLRALEKDPARRFADADEFAAALLDARERPTVVAKEMRSSRIRCPASRSSTRSATPLALVAVAAAGAAAGRRSRSAPTCCSRPRRSRSPTWSAAARRSPPSGCRTPASRSTSRRSSPTRVPDDRVATQDPQPGEEADGGLDRDDHRLQRAGRGDRAGRASATQAGRRREACMEEAGFKTDVRRETVRHRSTRAA